MNKTAYIIGIGGIGMSALAQAYQSQGYVVQGSDAVLTEVTAMLEKKEMQVTDQQIGEYISEDISEVIYTLAIPEDHPERVQARALGIPEVSYPEAIGRLTQKYKTIAVCGTHGKTTTTAMLALTCIAGGLDPTVIVGSTLKEFGKSNFRAGASDLLIIEACEYKEAFMNYSPTMIVCTNVEPEHLDYYKTPERYYESFGNFFKKVREKDGMVFFLQTGQERHTKIGELVGEHSIAALMAPYEQELLVGVPGEHNRENASLVRAIAEHLGITQKIIHEALKNYKGSWRRFELKGEIPTGAILYDDYAHHPTEIVATLLALRDTYPEKRLVAVFQPHQYSRTAFFLQQFSECFSSVDEVIISNIYRVRDTDEDVARVTPEKLVTEIGKHHSNARFGEGLEKTQAYLLEHTDPETVIILLGAGDITTIGDALVG